MNQNNNDREQQIIKKFQKKQSITIYTAIFSIILILLLLILGLLTQYTNTKIYRTIEILLVLDIIFVVYVIIMRKCPNCKRTMGKYNISPTKCPYCGAKLR